MRVSAQGGRPDIEPMAWDRREVLWWVFGNSGFTPARVSTPAITKTHRTANAAEDRSPELSYVMSCELVPADIL